VRSRAIVWAKVKTHDELHQRAVHPASALNARKHRLAHAAAARRSGADAIEIESLRHAAKENGQLVVTYTDFAKYCTAGSHMRLLARRASLRRREASGKGPASESEKASDCLEVWCVERTRVRRYCRADIALGQCGGANCASAGLWHVNEPLQNSEPAEIFRTVDIPGPIRAHAWEESGWLVS
jgi:hypothetical protein